MIIYPDAMHKPMYVQKSLGIILNPCQMSLHLTFPLAGYQNVRFSTTKHVGLCDEEGVGLERKNGVH